MKKRLPAFLLAAMLVASLAACSVGEGELPETAGSSLTNGQTGETNPSSKPVGLTEPFTILAAEPSSALTTERVPASKKPAATGAAEKNTAKRAESAKDGCFYFFSKISVGNSVLWRPVSDYGR